MTAGGAFVVDRDGDVRMGGALEGGRVSSGGVALLRRRLFFMVCPIA